MRVSRKTARPGTQQAHTNCMRPSISCPLTRPGWWKIQFIFSLSVHHVDIDFPAFITGVSLRGRRVFGLESDIVCVGQAEDVTVDSSCPRSSGCCKQLCIQTNTYKYNNERQIGNTVSTASFGLSDFRTSACRIEHLSRQTLLYIVQWLRTMRFGGHECNFRMKWPLKGPAHSDLQRPRQLYGCGRYPPNNSVLDRVGQALLRSSACLVSSGLLSGPS